MYSVEFTDEYERRHKRYSKKRPRELDAVLDNLDTYLAALRAGARPHAIVAGYIHNEPAGVRALDQKGGGKDLQQTRLYIYPDESLEVLYVVTLGDKQSQPDDILFARNFVENLKRSRQEDQDVANVPEKREEIQERLGDAPDPE